MTRAETRQLNIYGVVQGIGFRPFVARLAEELGILGEVRNSGGAVVVTATAEPALLAHFAVSIRDRAPFGAQIYRMEEQTVPLREFTAFSIIPSDSTAPSQVGLPVDLPTCPDCERELADPNDPRWRYPFISCVACGPRYSVIEALPYDRPNTTMDAYEMCGLCEAEYTGNGRRRHAQTISCHDCGPQLLLRTSAGEWEREEALQQAIRLLREGAILAVKGIGGYHLACSPFLPETVQRLRRLKGREQKPFAVMFPDLQAIRCHTVCSEAEQRLLTSVARPIVLLRRLAKSDICREVYGESHALGAFLPYTPLQRLLLEVCGPLVLTSANRTDEPIYYTEAQLAEMEPELDGVLWNTRRIVLPLDDSVAQCAGERVQLIRRSRGYVPAAIPLPASVDRTVFAAGGDLKAVFGFWRDGLAYLSQYFGDMESAAIHRTYRQNKAHMQALFSLQPNLTAADSNPGYFTTRMAQEAAEPVVLWQHHHAHIASVMAEHGLQTAIGVAFDGTGLGTDGSVWGGEFLYCSGSSMQRMGHLRSIPVCGYDNAAKDASLYAQHLLLDAALPTEDSRVPLLRAALQRGVNTIPSSSSGRLFDGVAALLGLAAYNRYEGECAVLLEQAAWRALECGAVPRRLPFPLEMGESGFAADHRPLLQALYAARRRGEDADTLALAFHLAVAEAVREGCLAVRRSTGCTAVALSGGVFVNRLLLQEVWHRLEEEGFTVYTNELVPVGDGGLALGQLWLTLRKAEEEAACV